MKKHQPIITLVCMILIHTGLSGQEKQTFTIDGNSFSHEKRVVNRSASCPETPFRSVDGTCNNLSNPNKMEWGATDIPLRRNMTPAYGITDHLNDMGGTERISPRAISNYMSAQDEETPSRQRLSSFVFNWGQFLDHDISLTPEGHTEYEPILMPVDEPLFTSSIPFLRSEIHENTGANNYREQTNLITSYIDGSNVYGSDQERADWLRTFRDGKMKVSTGNLLPFNTYTGQSDGEIDPSAPSMAGDNGGTSITFVAGDVRAAEQPGLTSLHTLFLRQHNQICQQLRNQGLTNDEEIYQRARKEVGALIQSITYNEFLPALGVRLRRPNGYNANIKVDISNSFATAAYRLGHTMVTDEILLKDNQCHDVDDGTVSLLEGFFNPSVVVQYNIDPILKGLSVQVQNEVDTKIIDNLRNFLFGDPSSGNAAGIDLASLNIQRGRDHGLPDYNTARKIYTGRAAERFRDISREREVREALEKSYADVNQVDLWVGLLAEDKRQGSTLGRTLEAMLKRQFEDLRDGDRFFFLYDPFLPQQLKNKIQQTKLSDIIKMNTNINNIQRNVFLANNCNNLVEETNIETREVSGLEDKLSFTVYPNPATDLINLAIQNSDTGVAEIYDAKGSLLMAQTFDESQLSILVTELNAGMYYIKVKANDQLVQKKLIVIE